jgi:DNA-binding MarR family transcriptional regulator
LLEGVVAHLECSRAAHYDGGDHLIIVGEVEQYRRYDRQALLFTQGRYAVAADHPELSVPSLTHDGAAPGEDDDKLFAWMLIQAYGAFTSGLDAARLSHGLTLMQARLLRAIRSSPGSALEALVPKLLFGLNAGEGVLSELVEKGFVNVVPGGALFLTAAGERTFQTVVRLARTFEEQEFSAVAPEDIAACRRVLSTVISRGHATRRSYPWM